MNQMRKKLKEINEDMARILSNGSDEKVMVFTDDRILIELAQQINEILEDRRRVKAEYRHQEIGTRKMLSNISHDIKTPLTVILGYLEIMRLENPGDAMLEKVESKALQVLEMMNEFFTLSKLEAGDADITIERMDIVEICRENILDFYEVLNQNSFEVEISLPEQSIYVQGEKNALHRIFFNLISNVVRYGADGKYIGLSLRQDEDWVYAEVTDKGKGIEKEFAERVFERLFTMEDSRSRKVQGNGLGLTIAKNLALRLGGDILLDSRPYEKTTFTVKLRKSISDEIFLK